MTHEGRCLFSSCDRQQDLALPHKRGQERENTCYFMVYRGRSQMRKMATQGTTKSTVTAFTSSQVASSLLPQSFLFNSAQCYEDGLKKKGKRKTMKWEDRGGRAISELLTQYPSHQPHRPCHLWPRTPLAWPWLLLFLQVSAQRPLFRQPVWQPFSLLRPSSSVHGETAWRTGA